MRYLLPLIPIISLIFSCVKPPSEDPVPVIEFKDIHNMRKAISYYPDGKLWIRDTAVLVLGYADGDGDIFRNKNSDGPNLVYTTYAFNQDSNKFVIDNFPNPATITQPADGYYLGKSIHGEIFVPMPQFRSSDNVKVLKFQAFMEDMKGHKSNVVTSPVYTLNF